MAAPAAGPPYPSPLVPGQAQATVVITFPVQGGTPNNPITVTGTLTHPTNPNADVSVWVWDKNGIVVAVKNANHPAAGQWTQVLDVLDPAKSPYTIEARVAIGAGHVITVSPVTPPPIPIVND